MLSVESFVSGRGNGRGMKIYQHDGGSEKILYMRQLGFALMMQVSKFLAADVPAAVVFAGSVHDSLSHVFWLSS